MSNTSTLTSSRTVALRTRPTQERSRKTFDAILTAAAELLIESGWDGFNTNLLAERAGCRVATLYRYFPDKLAVVSTLAETVISQWDRALAQVASDLESARDLRKVWPEFLHRFISILRSDASALAVRQAMYAVPALRAMDQSDNQRLAEQFAEILGTQLANVPATQLLSSARVMIESAVAVIDLAMTQSDQVADGLLRDLESMHLAYLDQLYTIHHQSSGGADNV